MRRSRKSSSRRNIRPDHTLVEQLESRQLLATITWDGGGDGTTLTQATNWSGDVLPGASDDAVINVAGTPTIAISSGTFSVNSLDCAETFNMTGGTITVAAASTFSGALGLGGGTVNGAGNIAVTSTMNWSGG